MNIFFLCKQIHSHPFLYQGRESSPLTKGNPALTGEGFVYKEKFNFHHSLYIKKHFHFKRKYQFLTGISNTILTFFQQYFLINLLLEKHTKNIYNKTTFKSFSANQCLNHHLQNYQISDQ